MDEHPIQALMQTAMHSIKEMIEVNTVVGDAVETPDGTIIMPVTRVVFGFAAGGAEYTTRRKQSDHRNDNNDTMEDEDDSDSESQSQQSQYPFGGGSGAGVSVQPVAFMVVGNGGVKMMSVHQPAPIERLIDQVPQLITKVQEVASRKKSIVKERTVRQIEDIDEE